MSVLFCLSWLGVGPVLIVVLNINCLTKKDLSGILDTKDTNFLDPCLRTPIFSLKTFRNIWAKGGKDMPGRYRKKMNLYPAQTTLRVTIPRSTQMRSTAWRTTATRLG